MRAVVVTNKVRRYTNGFKVMIEPLMELGFEVIWAANFAQLMEERQRIPCETYQVDFMSNPLHPSNITATLQLLSLLRQKRVDLIHCNTPIGGLIGRVCARVTNVQKVVYTAHGFHFYRGAPFVLGTVARWYERYFARHTDVILTINREDYEAARTFSVKSGGKVYLIHGAGIDTEYVSCCQPSEKRKELGVPESAIMLVSAGELNKNKNYQIVIRALAQLRDESMYYVLCGDGILKPELERLARKLGVAQRVIFAGYRTDVLDILASADIFVMPSFREGLPRSLMEAMVAGLPCVASNIRGAVDLLEDGCGGFLREPTDVTAFAEAIRTLAQDPELRKAFGKRNQNMVKQFDFNNVKAEMKTIYRSLIQDCG